MTMAIIVPVAILMGIRYVSSGFNYKETFEHMSLRVFLLVLVSVPFFSIGFSFLVAQLFRCARVTISNGEIEGVGSWGNRNRIPLNDISKLRYYSAYGINGLVVRSRYHGQVFISDKTRNLGELLDILAVHLPESEESLPQNKPAMDKSDPGAS